MCPRRRSPQVVECPAEGDERVRGACEVVGFVGAHDGAGDAPVTGHEIEVDGSVGGEARGLDAAFYVGEKGGVVEGDKGWVHGHFWSGTISPHTP